MAQSKALRVPTLVLLWGHWTGEKDYLKAFLCREADLGNRREQGDRG